MHANAPRSRAGRNPRIVAPLRGGGIKQARAAPAATLAQAARIDIEDTAPFGRAGFMNDAMWFAWLLRPDVRQGAAMHNLAAQREFVVWWLLDGPSVFPGGWSADPACLDPACLDPACLDPACLDIVMEPVQMRPGFMLPRLLRGLYRRRADLRAAYPLHDLENLYEFLAWYRAHGETEMKLAPRLPQPFHDLTEAASLRPPWVDHATSVPRMAVRLHGDSAALQAEFDPHTSEGRCGLANWHAAQLAVTRISAPPPPPDTPRAGTCAPPAAANGRRGVNLIGYPRGEFGIGEDIRTLARALDEAGIPYAVHDLQSGSAARQADSSLADHITAECPYPIDILCQTAFDTACCFLQGRLPGQNAARGRRYTIGNWPWELQKFPACWRRVYTLVDEVWAATRFTYDAYTADLPDHVFLMPPAVCLDPTVAPRRRRDEADATPYVFLCPFDPNSFAARKNPAGALRAFQAAFPHGDDTVRLVLRSNGSLAGRPEFAALRAAAESDPRCILEEGTLSRADYQRRVAAADCLISPHRAEGFGRNIAEAILLGVQVLATGASGCTDFLQPAECLNWSPRPVCHGEYPYAEGMFWAEPDLADMIDRMRQVRGSAGPPAARREALHALHGAQAAGARVASRLAEIFRCEERK